MLPRAVIRKGGFALALSLGVGLLVAAAAVAHEAWVLSPEAMATLNGQPLPAIFTQFNAVNVSMYVGTLLFLVGWISLNYTGARELFPDLQVRLGSYGGYASLGLRLALFVLLGMAGTGLGPRAGTALYEAPTLAAPDLELRILGAEWAWIAWVEIAVALCLLLGIYVRGAATVVLGLAALGLFTFGWRMVDYLGLVGGAAVYLLLQGAGSYYVPMPSVPGTRRLQAWLESQPRARAQFLLQVLAGFNLAYLGVYWKGFHANSMLAILQHHQVPTFGIQAATFVLWMALVETLSGLLIMAGVLMRFLSVILFASFLFFSGILGESVFAHIIFYGLLVSFITNGDGRWRRPVAEDKPGKIVILGGGVAGLQCAMRLERLLGEFTNVKVTLVHRESYFLFEPLLPEVVGGAVQPGSIVNSIRRLCPRTSLIHGEVTSIDPEARRVQVDLDWGETATVDYDQLVVALGPDASFAGVPGLLEHALPMATIGDALFLRQQVLQRMEHAEVVADPAVRRALLTFAVVGGSLRGTATAAEIRALIKGALVSYPAIGPQEPRVLLFEDKPDVLPQFGPAMGAGARRRLQKLGVEVAVATRVAAVTPDEVVLASGQRIPCRVVVSALANRPSALAALPSARPDGRLPVDEFFRVDGAAHILAVGYCAATGVSAPPVLMRSEIRMARRVAYNALALHRGYKLQRWSEATPRLRLAPLGRYATIGSFFGVHVAGLPAWVFSRAWCLLTLPGLEREVIRQGERGDCAYVIVDGEAEVLRQVNGHWERVRRLKAGECFGEIALLADVPRTATVRCLSPVDLIVLPRDQFMTLARGYRDLGTTLERGMTERFLQEP
ncbi:MAG: cyclic nucleotide-binding domain-containing protein [Candidatus Rokuibacteriota bacterium]|nr:MAG: cyclic nucleotide-binding domain-containing protein [Candidatus Rokubacteria bacterium]